MKTILVGILALEICVPLICAATDDPAKRTATETFLSLADKRAETQNQIVELNVEIESLKNKIQTAQDNQNGLAAAQKRINELRTLGKQRTEDDEKEYESLKKDVLSLNEKLKAVDIPQWRSLLEDRKKELLAAKMAAGDVQSEILSMLAPEQKFKYNMGVTFAVLIGAVVLGFFVISIVDKSVRQEIFAHEAGIQFISLFSIVIAIILFGITGILEGKELAALLAGLSGYILGRVAPRARKDEIDGPRSKRSPGATDPEAASATART